MARRPWNPEEVLAAIARGEAACGDLGIRIDRRGIWHYRGSPIPRPALVRLFATVLHRAPDGSYWLVTPVERGRVEVEDVPFVAVELRREGEGRGQMLELRTNLDTWVTVDEAHPVELRPPSGGGAPVPYLRLERGLDARILQPVFYELAELAEPGPDGGALGVWSRGRFFALESCDDQSGADDGRAS